jgi:hypothetical protein
MMSESIVEKLADVSREVPEEVTAWLGRLVLLYGVPLNYLIPDEVMMPKESIRFFFLDPIWIQYLVQGACSIGNTGYGDTIVDRAMNAWVQPNQPRQDQRSGAAAKAAAGVRDRLRNQLEGVELPAADQDLNWPLTGFLLRSAVVDGWRGLEIMAYRKLTEAQKNSWPRQGLNAEQMHKLESEGVAPLKALRIEQLCADVMLGIFNGVLGQLVIRQPQEGLHFGLSPQNGSFTKTLRKLGYKDPASAGTILKESINLSQSDLVRDQKQSGVLKISALAALMEKKLKDELSNGRFTSAEFAVEMIEAPGEFTFIATRPDGPP